MAKLQGKIIVTIAVLLFIMLEAVNGGVLDRDPRSSKQFNTRAEPRGKRPFCNAFTGCGRKRSETPALPEIDDEESVTELLDLNAEPAIEDLMRQIMSEAKMYEAIQEANREMYLQKLNGNKHQSNQANRIAFSMQ
ncbi:unnamed protein product [Diamesa hyperborea]